MKNLIILLVTMCFMLLTSCKEVTPSDVQYLAWQKDKYLWASTQDELIRWNVQNKESETFPNVAGELFVDSKDTLWVFDKGTISHFDGQEWQKFTDEFAPGRVFCFAEGNGYIWVGTFGLSRYNQQNKSWEILFEMPPGLVPTPVPQDTIVEVLPDGVYSIAPVTPNDVWLGTSRGLTYWEDNFQQTWTNNDLNTDGVLCLLDVPDGEVWICTDSEVGRWDGSQWLDVLKAPDDRKQLFQGDNQDVWVTDRQIGVAKWDGVSWQNWTSTLELNYPPDQDSLLGAHSLIVSTTDSNIWVATGGVRRWDGRHWRTYTTNDGLNSNSVNTLIQDPTGTLWAGTREGINYYDSDTDRWYPFPDK